MKANIGSAPLTDDPSVKKPGDGELTIDWSLAVPVSTSGTTCDTFRYEYNNRRIFIKKLKEGVAANVRYLDSIRKEFEVGRMLEHPALPNYESAHGTTWLATRYVDGRTLAELISRKDQWLAKTENVRKMLAELLDVVTYLHAHGVTHSDIHAGNVMLDRTHMLKLIDLGLCYTDWAPKSSGHPSHIGIDDDEKGSPLIDFRMIGDLTQHIIEAYPALRSKQFSKFIAACQREDVTAEILADILNEPPQTNKHNIWLWSAVAMTIAISIGLVVTFYKKDLPEIPSTQEAQADTILIEHPTAQPTPAKEKQPAPAQEPKPVDISAIMRDVNAEITRSFQPLYADIRRLEELATSDTTDYKTLIRVSTDYADRAEMVQDAVKRRLLERYPGITANVICTSEAWFDYNAADHRMSELVSGEVRRRAQAQAQR